MPEIPENFGNQILAHRLNFAPFIGCGQDNYAPVRCYANYAAHAWGLPSFAFMDGEGKIVMYFSAVDKQGRSQVFRAHQSYQNAATSFINEPVRPKFLGEHELVHSVRGLGTYFVCLYLTDDTPEQNPTRVVIVRTRSSDPLDWTDYVETKRPYVNEYTEGSTFYYDHKSGNFLRAWPTEDGKQMWYALYDSTLFRSRQLIKPTKLLDVETDLGYDEPTNRLIGQKESARIDPLSVSMTYDRLRGDMVIMFSVLFTSLDTKSGHPLSLRRSLLLNYSMSEGTLADGRGLVLNNIPYGVKTNYNLSAYGRQPIPAGLYVTEHTVAVAPEDCMLATVGFNEYYEGSVSVTEQIGHGGWNSVRYWEFDPSRTFTGADQPRPDRTYVLALQSRDLPSCVSSGFAKDITAIDGRLVMSGRLATIEGYAVTDSDIARIEPGNVIRLKANHSHTTVMTNPGNYVLSNLHRLTTVVQGVEGSSRSFSYGVIGPLREADRDSTAVHRIYKEGGLLSSADTAFVMPPMPEELIIYDGWTFNAKADNPTFWVLGSPTRWQGTQKDGWPLVYEYNRLYLKDGHGHDGGWKEHSAVIDPDGIAQATSETSVIAPLRLAYPARIMFTNKGHIAIATCWRADGPFGTDPTISLFDPITDSVLGSFRVKPQRGPQDIGWHPTLGYFAVDDVSPEGASLRAQGRLSYEEFWMEGRYTSYFLPVDRANSNIISVGATAVFLGGRFSDYSGGDVPLPLNQRSYVYLERKRDPPYPIEIRTTDSLLPNTFDRVLISEIEADDIGAVSQKDYPVNWKP